MQKLSHTELLSRQAQSANGEHLPFCALLNNIRSLYNVGSIFRTADGAGLEKLWICGITGFPPAGKIAKTALGAEKSVPWEYVRSPVDCIQKLKSQGYQIVMLEQTHQSIPYQDFEPEEPVCLVVGNEITGVDDPLLPFCDAAVEIDMAGGKNSLNVTVAFGIVAYDLRNKILMRKA